MSLEEILASGSLVRQHTLCFRDLVKHNKKRRKHLEQEHECVERAAKQKLKELKRYDRMKREMRDSFRSHLLVDLLLCVWEFLEVSTIHTGVGHVCRKWSAALHSPMFESRLGISSSVPCYVAQVSIETGISSMVPHIVHATGTTVSVLSEDFLSCSDDKKHFLFRDWKRSLFAYDIFKLSFWEIDRNIYTNEIILRQYARDVITSKWKKCNRFGVVMKCKSVRAVYVTGRFIWLLARFGFSVHLVRMEKTYGTYHIFQLQGFTETEEQRDFIVVRENENQKEFTLFLLSNDQCSVYCATFTTQETCVVVFLTYHFSDECIFNGVHLVDCNGFVLVLMVQERYLKIYNTEGELLYQTICPHSNEYATEFFFSMHENNLFIYVGTSTAANEEAEDLDMENSYYSEMVVKIFKIPMTNLTSWKKKTRKQR